MTWLDDVRHISGMISLQEAEILHQYAQEAAQDIVEIGSYLGQSTVALALGSRSGHGVPVWAIDPHEAYTVQVTADVTHTFTPHNRGYFMQNIVSAGVADIVRLISLPSAQAARCWERRIGLLFVDGRHDYANVRSDLAAWYMYVIPGGHILLHDYDQPDVQRAVADIAKYNFARLSVLSERIACLTIHPNSSHHLWSITCKSAS